MNRPDPGADTEPASPVPQRLPIPGLPANLVAIPVGHAGQSTRNRSGHLRAGHVDLHATHAPTGPADPALLTDLGLSARDAAWLLKQKRRQWSTVTKHWNTCALDLAHRLAAAGVLTVRHPVNASLRLSTPILIDLTPRWAELVTTAQEHRADTTSTLAAQARTTAALIEALDTGLARTLSRARGHEPRLPDLLAAAQDLADGASHDGPRAFSQAHFADTKTHDDIANILRENGASDSTLLALGLTRAQYLGIAGPVSLGPADSAVDLSLLRGPVLLRADQTASPTLRKGVRAIVIVENIQAAEALADNHRDIAVLYTAGQPGDPSLALISALVQASPGTPVHVVPDADLGGVRIATRILTAAPHARVHDIGTQPHAAGRAFGAVSLTGLRAALPGPAGPLARACLDRGYRVEQEAATRAAIGRLLSG